MILLKTKAYKKSVAALPKKISKALVSQEILLIENIFHPKLHAKKLKGFPGDFVCSFRISRDYRGVFSVSGKRVILFKALD
jgi:mRNA-degrading endonuclease RelE of RelBE toxin-antitoxin system